MGRVGRPNISRGGPPGQTDWGTASGRQLRTETLIYTGSTSHPLDSRTTASTIMYTIPGPAGATAHKATRRQQISGASDRLVEVMGDLLPGGRCIALSLWPPTITVEVRLITPPSRQGRSRSAMGSHTASPVTPSPRRSALARPRPDDCQPGLDRSGENVGDADDEADDSHGDSDAEHPEGGSHVQPSPSETTCTGMSGCTGKASMWRMRVVKSGVSGGMATCIMAELTA